MSNWLIDTTDIYQIQYDLLREAQFGDAKLGFLGLDNNQAFTSLIPGGLPVGWQGRKSNDPSQGQLTRYIDVLMIAPVTADICEKTIALQIANIIYNKVSQSPDDGSTPSKWTFDVEYSRDVPIVL